MNISGEIWKPIPGYVGLYQCSNIGRIKSLGNNMNRKEKILKGSIDKKGYRNCILQEDKIKKCFFIHTLVAMCFMKFVPDGYNKIITHKNGNILDNRPANLKIISRNIKRFNKFKIRFYEGVNHVPMHWVVIVYGKKYGCFDSEIEAHEAYQNALKSLLK